MQQRCQLPPLLLARHLHVALQLEDHPHLQVPFYKPWSLPKYLRMDSSSGYICCLVKLIGYCFQIDRVEVGILEQSVYVVNNTQYLTARQGVEVLEQINPVIGFISSSTLICPISSVSCLSIWGIRSERPFFVAVSLSLACFSRILAILSSIVPYFSTMVFRLAAISAWSILIPKSVACSLVIFPAFRASSTHLRNSSYLSFMPLMRRSSSESVSSVICLYILSSSWAYFSSMAARSSAFFAEYSIAFPENILFDLQLWFHPARL